MDALTSAYEGDGLVVQVRTRAELFVNLNVHDPVTGESSEPQLGWDHREFPPARFDIGQVLNERDAVANKMTALFSRGEVRDFIDIDAVVESGRFSRDDVLALADTRESLPLDRTMLAQRFEMPSDPNNVGQYGPRQFANYGVGAEARAALVERFAQWAADLSPDSEEGALSAEEPSEVRAGIEVGRS